MKTPDFGHVDRTTWEHVYEPSEDTYLLLDALEADAEEFKRTRPRVCLEIGSGSGCVTTFLGMLLGSMDCAPGLLLCTDVNERAAHTTRATAIQNHVHPVEPILTNFTDALLPRLRHSVDILIFNPPYVVTADAEVGSHAIDAAWAGGRDGRVVVDRLIESGTVGELLSDRGVFYLVAIRQNRPDELQRMLEEKHGFESTVAMDRRAGIEHLHVLKFWRRGRIVV